MYNKTCKICECAFVSVTRQARFCEACADIKKKERILRNSLIRAKNPGVGKGGAPLKGEDNPNYKHGKYVFETLRNEIKDNIRYCQRCTDDLINADRYHWVVHHKDHNHWNHSLDNLELLCKRCHQIEHECHKAFSKRATTSREAYTQAGGNAENPTGL